MTFASLERPPFMTAACASLVKWVVGETKQNVVQKPDQPPQRRSDEDGGAARVNLPLVSPYEEMIETIQVLEFNSYDTK